MAGEYVSVAEFDADLEELQVHPEWSTPSRPEVSEGRTRRSAG
jgi:hypothetical protein